jgi:hypothetical protein
VGYSWLPLGTFPPVIFRQDELRPMIARLRELTRQAGRAEDAVGVCLGGMVRFEDSAGPERLPLKGSAEQIGEDIRGYQAIGVNDFILYLPGREAASCMDSVKRFAREVVPLVA